MAKKHPGNHYLWFDTEFSTLDLDRAVLLQVAMIVTDARLRRAHPPEQDQNFILDFDGMADPWVEENLAGLMLRCRGGDGYTVEEVDEKLAEHLDGIFGRPSPEIRLRPVIAGNSVHADWYLIRRFLPKLVERVHYRLLDVTTVKLEWLRWFKGSTFDKEDPEMIRRYFSASRLGGHIGPHDAYYDVQASIAELHYYRSRLQKNNGEATS